MNSDTITELVYEHMKVEAMVVQKCDETNTLLVFTEGEEIEKKYVIHCNPLRCGWITV